MEKAVRVVVVDDSRFVCRLLTSYLQSAPDLEVVGAANDGAWGLKLVQELTPDVVTLDLDMPGLSGLEVLQEIMWKRPTAVVVISGVSERGSAQTLEALRLGAVDFVLKYTPGANVDPEVLRQEIVAKVRAAARIRVVRSVRPAVPTGTVEAEPVPPAPSAAAPPRPERVAPPLTGGVVVIGASTGGPIALRELLSQLPVEFPATVVVVQHIPASFTAVLAAQLDRASPLPVFEATDGCRLIPGQVLVAPGGRHLLLSRYGTVEIRQGPEVGGHCPSIDVTMQSAAQVYGLRASGVVLSGMGDDGTQGLMAIHARGGKTFAQDAESCVIYGMPQRAIERGVVDCIAPPREIARRLLAEQAAVWRLADPPLGAEELSYV